MTRYLLDSGIASDFINRRHGVFERARAETSQGHRVGIGVPVLAGGPGCSRVAPVARQPGRRSRAR